MPIWGTINFQDRNSPTIEHLIYFHDHAIVVVVFLIILFFLLTLVYMSNKNFNHNFLESHTIEFFWTFSPSLLLFFLAVPSLKLLYIIEESIEPIFNIKITGYQWFWNYEYIESNKNIINNLIERNILKCNKKLKLLETSNNVILPFHIPTRLLVTSKDVIHSWSMPSLCNKVDAVPGRINQIVTIANRPGIFVGQCSEICGSGHRFIPILMESIKINRFLKI